MLPIYVDMDDVLCDSMATYLQILAREFNKQVAFEDVHTFDLQEAFKLTPDEYEHFFYILHQDEIIMALAPMAGAVRAVQNWHARGCPIAIVTGRPPETREASRAWLTRHRVPFQSFTLVNKYARQAAAGDTSLSLEALSRLKFCLAIEDSAKMARFITSHMAVPVALLDRPWNRSINGHPGLTRYATWHDIGRGHPDPSSNR